MPAAAATGRGQVRGIAVIACALAVLATSSACGGGDDEKADSPAAGARSPGQSAPPVAPGTPAASASALASPDAAPTGSTLRSCATVTATAKPTRGTLSKDDLRSASTNSVPLTGDEVFGLPELSYKYPGGTLTRTCVKILDNCAPIASDKAAELIAKLGCTRAVAALYVDKANNVQTTVGVLEMPTAIAAATLAESDAGAYNQVEQPTAPITKTFEDGAAYSWVSESLYRYFIYEMTGRMDGTDRTPAEVDKHVAAQNAVYHLVGDSLDRRSAAAGS
ncbi:hypothetical protein [Embleya scabrispora]|uniref:hypothetical protein n=1 Tax=Embleya scabrispora TaxID=159449 RepID=UPI000361FFC2|nr:hypothetical protein [Embleya scabrispora]MYS87360.1 hypothetical protein [Streptomyces sp. SID5474]